MAQLRTSNAAGWSCRLRSVSLVSRTTAGCVEECTHETNSCSVEPGHVGRLGGDDRDNSDQSRQVVPGHVEGTPAMRF
jgi:hypothetical protein